MAGIHEGIDMFIVFSDADITDSGFGSQPDVNQFFGSSYGSLSSPIFLDHSTLLPSAPNVHRDQQHGLEVFVFTIMKDISHADFSIRRARPHKRTKQPGQRLSISGNTNRHFLLTTRIKLLNLRIRPCARNPRDFPRPTPNPESLPIQLEGQGLGARRPSIYRPD
jgi:hypothetical protein